MDGCFMDPFVQVEVRLDWDIERNFGLEDRGYSDVQLNLSDLEREFQFGAVLRTGEPNRLLQPIPSDTNGKGVRYSEAALRKWYSDVYVPEAMSRPRPPNRDEDLVAARQEFGRNIPERAIRHMRRELAPKHWKASGRPPDQK